MKFDIRQTNIAKGIALLLLLWHHLFYNNPTRYDWYTSLFYIGDKPVEAFLADFFLVCVSIFLFLSGYGIFKSYESYLKRNTTNELGFKGNVTFVKNRLIKLLSSYYVIYIIFVPMGLFFGRSFITIYGGDPLKYLADMFGLSYLFYGYSFTMNATWWYMSIIIVYTILYPLLHKACKYSGIILLLFSVLISIIPLNMRQLQLYIAPFVLGMSFADSNGFEYLDKKLGSISKKVIFSIIILAIAVSFRYLVFKQERYFYFLFAFSIVLISYFFISKIPFINKILEEIGKKSGKIFMMHTFIYLFYFSDFIYGFKYSVIIYIVLLVVCYLIALALDWLMKITRYNKLIDKWTASNASNIKAQKL